MFRPNFVSIFWKVLYEVYIIKTSKPMYKYRIHMTSVKENVSTTLRLLSLSYRREKFNLLKPTGYVMQQQV